jgi:phage N-6-adenine-methyltransferase
MSDNWETPKAIYDKLNSEFHFDFDPCPSNPQFDGLSVVWGLSNFVNPPYSQTEKWCRKALEESRKGKLVVMLLRLDASTHWFRDVVLPNAEVRLFYDRVSFINPKTGKASRSDHASILAIFGNGGPRLNLPIIENGKRGGKE